MPRQHVSIWDRSPQLSAGAGGNPYRAEGTLYWENPAVANTADTNYISSSEYVLPANTLATNGDRLLIEAHFLMDGTAATKSYFTNLGYASFSAASGFSGGFNNSGATASVSVSLHLNMLFTRTSSTTGYKVGVLLFSSTSMQGSAYTGCAVTWANAQNIRAAGRSTDTSTAGLITLHEFRVTYFPR